MTVIPLAIQFNHDLAAARSDALNLRRNGTSSIALPEWRRGATIEPAHCPVAYAMTETEGSTITISAQFGTDESSSIDAWVRTENAGSTALGRVRPTRISVRPGAEGQVHSLELVDVDLWQRGVGVNDIAWRWQIRREAGDDWHDVALTEHRIFTLLETPKPPWSQEPMTTANTQLPWADLLEYACRWASGATTPDAVATRVTRAVNGLGGFLLEYDCPGQGGTHYTWYHDTPWAVFDCTSFLQLLHGDPLASRYVNCVDCATIVASVANVLGCDLSTSGMRSDAGVPFALNPIRAIGSRVWRTACGWGAFKYHEVAWTGACDVDDDVFDACLHVDGDTDPARAPHTPLLPTSMRFGRSGEGLYRDRLAAPGPEGRPNCIPQPETTRRRRPIV